MALIGQIAIAMTVKTAQFKKGLSAASNLLKSFEKSALSDFRKGILLIGSGLKDMGVGLGGIALIVGSGLGALAKYAASISVLGSTITSVFKGSVAYVRDWGKALYAIFGSGAVSALKGFGGYLKDWGKALDSILGDKVRAVGRSLGTLGVGIGKVVAGTALMARGFAKLAIVGVAKSLSLVASTMMGVVKAAGAVYVAVRNAAVQLVKFGAVAGGIAGFAIYKLVKTGSDLVENQNKIKEVFGTSSTVVVKAADQMAAAFGVSKNEFLDMTGKLGGIFRGAGYAQEAAAGLSVHFSKLAGDVASFFNIPIEDALQKLEAGLVGEIRPLRELGVSIDDDTVKLYAYKTGVAKLGAELTQSQKIQARIGLITSKLATAQGDLARTSNEVANASRGVVGRIGNLAGEIGEKLQPIARSVLGEINTALGAMSIAWEQNQNAVIAWGLGTVNATQGATSSVGLLQSAIGKIADAWQYVGIEFAKTQVKITTGVSWMIKNLPGFAKGVERIQRGIFGGKEVSEEDFKKTWLEDLSRMEDVQKKSLAKAAAAPKASENINAAFEASRKQIAAVRAGITSPDISNLKPGEDPFAKKVQGKVEFAKSASMGSSESTNAILRSKYGASTGKEKAPQETAKNTYRAWTTLEKIYNLAQGQARVTANNRSAVGMPMIEVGKT